ncbi:MAG: hypothetical protein ACR2HR_00145 [Euzebya sp.]
MGPVWLAQSESAPSASEGIIDEFGTVVAPNVDDDGGIVVSCDGRVAALVPPGVAHPTVEASLRG